MKNLMVFIVLSGCVFFTSFAFAEIPPPLKDVKVSATASCDRKSGVCTYTYEIYNSLINVGQVGHFEIDISSSPNDVILSREGLVNGACYNGDIPETLQIVKIIPVSMDAPLDYIPKYIELTGTYVTIWTCGPTVKGFAMFGSWDEDYNISPGQKFGGLKLISYGIPGIRDMVVEQDYVMDEEDVPEEVYENDRLKEYLVSVYSSIAYHGKTLGPTAPPADFKPMAFIDYIISLKHEAATLGWIKNKGIVNSLDVKLENAKKAIERNNIRPAKNLLEAFVNEVEAQGCATYDKCPEGKHITPEGYGLLKYNAEYLLERL